VTVLLSIAAGFYLTADYWSFGDEDEELHAVEGADDNKKPVITEPQP